VVVLVLGLCALAFVPWPLCLGLCALAFVPWPLCLGPCALALVTYLLSLGICALELGPFAFPHGGVPDSTLGWSAQLPVESDGLSLIPLQQNKRQQRRNASGGLSAASFSP
jgi:hypothetical protein